MRFKVAGDLASLNKGKLYQTMIEIKPVFFSNYQHQNMRLFTYYVTLILEFLDTQPPPATFCHKFKATPTNP